MFDDNFNKKFKEIEVKAKFVFFVNIAKKFTIFIVICSLVFILVKSCNDSGGLWPLFKNILGI